MTYDMQEYLENIVRDFESLAAECLKKPTFRCKLAPTPFLVEDTQNAPARAPSGEAIQNAGEKKIQPKECMVKTG